MYDQFGFDSGTLSTSLSHSHTCMHIYTHAHVHTHTHMHPCTYIYTHAHTSTHMVVSEPHSVVCYCKVEHMINKRLALGMVEGSAKHLKNGEDDLQLGSSKPQFLFQLSTY